MKKRIQNLGKATLLGALTISLAGCVTRTVYVTQTAPAPQPQVEQAPAPAPAEPAPAYQPADTVTIQTESDFYEPLSPYGQWVVVAGYGRCWQPLRVEASWRPYSYGHWVRTDAGWYWASSEPWGWATYHYGRWDWVASFGWIWVPQIQWAPAWVTWREGGGYVGWAPLPPSARIRTGGYVEVHETVVAPRFVFVEERHLLEPVHPRTVIVNNQTIVNKTVNITKIQVVNNNTVINEGPRTEIIEHASGKKVTPTPINDLRHEEEKPVADGRRHVPPGQAKKGRSDSPGHDKNDSVLPPGHEQKVSAPSQIDNARTTPPAKAPEQPVIKKEVVKAPEPPAAKKENAKTTEQPPIKKIFQPAATDERASDTRKPATPAKPAHAEPEKTQHNNQKSDAIPVAARPMPNPQPTSVAAPQQTPRVETQPAAPAREQQPPAPIAKPEVHEQQQPERNVKPANTYSESNGNSAPAPRSHQPPGQTISPKAASQHESNPGNSQKDQKKKKGDTTESNSAQ